MLDFLVISARNKMAKLAETFKSEERGASDMVVVIVLVVIVLALAVIFRKQLVELANSVMKNLGDFVKEE